MTRGAGKTAGRLHWACLAGIGLWYAAALNPYYLPDTYDNVLYHGAARSIAAGEGYRFGGEVIADWPPLFPAALAIPHLAGLHGVLAAKVVVLILALAGTLLAWRLAREEDRPWPPLIAAGLALTPTAFQMGTRIMAEWPYMLLSYAFLLALRRTAGRRDILSILAAGALLGVAGLTRYTGVFLMAALAWQALGAVRDGSPGSPAWRRVLPALAVGAVGAALWLGWAAYLALAARDDAVIAPQNLAPSTYGDFHPLAVLHAAANLLFCTQSVLGRLPVAAVAGTGVVVAVGAWGLVLRARRGAFGPSDAYTLAFLPFLAFYEGGEIPTLTRYLLPVGPFLLSWVFEGVRDLGPRLTGRVRASARVGIIASGVWLSSLMAVDAVLLVAGKPDGPHAGLLVLESPDPESFYRREWLDLYRACTFIRERPEPGAVSGLPDSTRYLAAWTGRDLVETRDGAPVNPAQFARVTYLVVPRDRPAPSGFTLVARFDSLTVWRRTR